MPHPAGAFLIYLLLTLVVVRVTAPAGLARRRATLLLTGFLAVLLPLGQAAENPRVLYPFVSWNMYAAPVPPEHLEYVAVDDRGRAFLYPFRLVAFIPAAAREAVWLIRLTIVLPYTFIGLHRLFEGGLTIFLGDALLHYIAQNTAGYSVYGLTWGQRLAELPLAATLLKAGFALVTLFELLSPGALVWPRFRRVWLVVMAAFHLIILATMNIFFWENLVLLLVVFGWVRTEVPHAAEAGTTAGPVYSTQCPRPAAFPEVRP